jgi:hypothetical protein
MSPDVELVHELATRCGGEQALRRLLEDPELPDSSWLWEKINEVDADNTAWLRGVLDRHGWPGFELVGPRGAADAWLLAQHAELGFQTRGLDLLRAAVAAGDADPANLAYLEDRVLIQQGLPQRYGTQARVDADGTTVLHDVEEPDTVDERRREVGLGPLAEYLALLREHG